MLAEVRKRAPNAWVRMDFSIILIIIIITSSSSWYHHRHRLRIIAKALNERTNDAVAQKSMLPPPLSPLILFGQTAMRLLTSFLPSFLPSCLPLSKVLPLSIRARAGGCDEPGTGRIIQILIVLSIFTSRTLVRRSYPSSCDMPRPCLRKDVFASMSPSWFLP